MAKVCDHTSVGAIVWQDDKLLLIERKKFPFGFACPAGHIDNPDESPEEAVKRELKEEVGLKAKKLTLLLEGKRDNPCRREGGSWHYWHVFEIDAEGDVKPSEEETKQVVWLKKGGLAELAKRTEMYQDGGITESEWEKAPGLEPVWYEILKELRVI